MVGRGFSRHHCAYRAVCSFFSDGVHIFHWITKEGGHLFTQTSITDEWISKMWCIQMMKNFLAIKWNEY